MVYDFDSYYKFGDCLRIRNQFLLKNQNNNRKTSKVHYYRFDVPENGQEQGRSRNAGRIPGVLPERRGHLHLHGRLRFVHMTLARRRSGTSSNLGMRPVNVGDLCVFFESPATNLTNYKEKQELK